MSQPTAAAAREEWLEDSRLEARDALGDILYAYDKALRDPQTKVPTYFMAVLEQARAVL